MAAAPRRRRPCLQRAAGLSCCSPPVLAAVLAVVTLSVLVSGCDRSSAGPAPGTASTDEITTAAAQRVMSGVATAALAKDKQAYDHLLDRTDPSFTTRAGWLWTNLTALPLARLQITMGAPSGTAAPLSTGSRHAVLPATLSWRVRGETRDASTVVGLTFARTQDQVRWTGVDDTSVPAPTGDAGVVRPLWWTAPVSVSAPSTEKTGAALVLTARGAPTPTGGSWPVLAQRAVRHAAAHAPSTPVGPVVVEVPADEAAFDQAAGRPADERTGLAAVTVGMGLDQHTAPSVVVVNPEAAGADGLEFVLTHEAVHAEWRSPATAAPMWLEEGFADAVAAAAYPRATRADDRRLRAEVTAHGAPRAFPPDADFRPDSDDLDTTYALARSICSFIVITWGWPELTSIMKQVAADPTAAWWTVLNASSRQAVEQQWSAWLARTAGR